MNTNDLVGLVIDALNDVGVAHMVTGSLASNVFGVARLTKDADFVLQLQGDEIRRIATALKQHFRLDEQMAFETITSTHKHKLQHLHSQFSVEFFDLSEEDFDQVRFKRRRLARVMDRSTWLPTPEDIIIQKLRWSPHHGRSQDFKDARNVADVQRDMLDWAYLEEWCGKHGTLGLLNDLRSGAKQ